MQTKKELKHSLVAYKKILTNSIFDYLNSILELEFSVLKKNISDDERKLLTELSIYREIAIYNIYNRALKLIKEIDLELPLEKDPDHSHIALVSKKEEIPVFSFEVNNSKEEKHLLGTINLYKRLYDASESKLLLESTEKTLQELRSERNPHNCNAGITDPMEIVYDGPDTWWADEHDNEIRHYENILKRLNERERLTEEEKKIIIATDTIHSILLKDYGLTNEDLVDEEQQKLQEIASIEDKIERELALISYSMKTYHLSYDLQDEKEKILTKRFPTITVKSNIRYII